MDLSICKTKINLLDRENENRRERILSSECKKAFNYLLVFEPCEYEGAFFENFEKTQEKMYDFFENDIFHRAVLRNPLCLDNTFFLHQCIPADSGADNYIRNDILYFYFSHKGNGVCEAGKGLECLIYELNRLCQYFETKKSLSLNEYNIKEFYDFIVHTKYNVLDNPWLRNAETAVYQAEISRLRADRQLSYLLLKLKFYLLNYVKNIQKIILIFDEISTTEDYDLSKRVYECMCNYDKDIYSGYQAKTVYAISEDVYWSLFYRIPEENFDISIFNEMKLDPEILFESRYQKAIQKGSVWLDKQGFGIADLNFAHETLNILNTKFNQKYKKMILQISQYQNEVILQCYKRIIFNQTWIQKETFRYDVDTYEENEGFLFTNITCIRALACGNNQVYTSLEEASHDLIPNILYNTIEEEYGIYCLLLMKYFLRNHPKKEPGHKQSEVLQIVRDIFGNEIGRFHQALEYLIRKSVIKKIEPENTTDSKEGILSMSPKGYELWDMLQNDSLLLENCREDYYRPFNTHYNMESSYKLIDSMQQYVIFTDLLLMIEDFKKWEDTLYNIVLERGKQAEYEQYFGKKRMSFYLLIGVSKSIEYSSSRSNIRLCNLRNQIESIVNSERGS